MNGGRNIASSSSSSNSSSSSLFTSTEGKEVFEEIVGISTVVFSSVGSSFTIVEVTVEFTVEGDGGGKAGIGMGISSVSRSQLGSSLITLHSGCTCILQQCTAQGGEVWHLLAAVNFLCLGPRERSERGPKRRKLTAAKRCRVSRR
ncbi:hypothetical protein TYRP_017170 [Tyrophagus putrescentiae]|nr:hypothetical protein TYRP_017170 [Tyrophagus putrescentiae]